MLLRSFSFEFMYLEKKVFFAHKMNTIKRDLKCVERIKTFSQRGLRGICLEGERVYMRINKVWNFFDITFKLESVKLDT